jgi:hypothetical protein
MGKMFSSITKPVLGLLGVKAPDAPVQQPEKVMPEPDMEAVAAARRRKVAAMQSRGGRESTILAGEDRLGG